MLLSKAATEVFEEIAIEQVEEEGRLSSLIDRALLELTSGPALTACEIAERLGEPLEAVEEALERAEFRSSLTSERRYSVTTKEDTD